MSGESLPEGYKQTKVGVIPVEWGVESIYNLSQRTNGVNPINNPDWTFKYVDVSCISQDTLKITNYLEYNGENAPSRARKLIKEGDILFSTIRPYLKQLAKVPATLDGEVCSTAFCIIRCDTKKVDPEYVFQSVTTDKFVSNVSSLQTGSNYPAVTDKDIFSQSIPLPPLPEQHRIATVLSTVDAAIAATDEVIAKTEDLKRGLMQDLLTKGIDEEGRVRSEETHAFCEKKGMWVPVEWNIGPLMQYITLISGQHINATDCNSTSEGVPYITGPSDYSQGIINATKYVTKPKTLCQKNDILITCKGSGTGSLVIADKVYCISRQLMAIRAGTINSEYLFEYLKYQEKTFEEAAVGTIPGISRSDILELKIPLPPLPEQHRIAAVLSTVDRDLAVEHDHRAHLQTLKKGLMQDLLTGRTRVPLNGGDPHGV